MGCGKQAGEKPQGPPDPFESFSCQVLIIDLKQEGKQCIRLKRLWRIHWGKEGLLRTTGLGVLRQGRDKESVFKIGAYGLGISCFSFCCCCLAKHLKARFLSYSCYSVQ